jgi:hypothetical protein
MRKVGERGCDRLIELIADPASRPVVELLPAELVLRSSCGCPAGPMTRHQVAPINRRKGPNPAKLPSPVRVAPVTSRNHAASVPPSEHAGTAADLTDDEITER